MFIFLGSFHIFFFPGFSGTLRSNNVVCGSKKTEVWDASKLKYEVIDTKLTGAPLQVVETDGGCRSFLGALKRDISGEIYKGNKLR